jgi:hypothetical protein
MNLTNLFENAAMDGFDNVRAILNAANSGQQAVINLGGEPITITYPEARFLGGKYRSYMKSGRQEEFVRDMGDARKFDLHMKQLRDLIAKQKNFRGSVPGQRGVQGDTMPGQLEEQDADPSKQRGMRNIGMMYNKRSLPEPVIIDVGTAKYRITAPQDKKWFLDMFNAYRRTGQEERFYTLMGTQQGFETLLDKFAESHMSVDQKAMQQGGPKSPRLQREEQDQKKKSDLTQGHFDVRAGMAEIYRRLAPKIERHRDSFLAGQLYDELENYAELHGAEGEFKRMMATARNSAHMEYDTNPGGFQNWFWFLPFEEQLDEKKSQGKKEVSPRMARILQQLRVAQPQADSDTEALTYAFRDAQVKDRTDINRLEKETDDLESTVKQDLQKTVNTLKTQRDRVVDRLRQVANTNTRQDQIINRLYQIDREQQQALDDLKTSSKPAVTKVVGVTGRQEPQPAIQVPPPSSARPKSDAAPVDIAPPSTSTASVQEPPIKDIGTRAPGATVTPITTAKKKRQKKLDFDAKVYNEPIQRMGESDMEEDIKLRGLGEAKKKPRPTNKELWGRAKSAARSKFDVYPSAYANAWAAKWYKSHGGGWRMGK